MDALRELHSPRELRDREQLLVSRGLFVPSGEGTYWGFFRDEELIATASLINGIIQGVAVSPFCEGEGLTSILLTAALKRGISMGLAHFFLFTKPAESTSFAQLGFTEVVSTRDSVLMEWGRPDVDDFKAVLQDVYLAAGTPNRAAAIVVNCNPFTLGHRWLLEQAAMQSEHLFVLVVEEDRSYFPFDARFRLVEEWVRDLKHVTVISSSSYAVSSATFPSYFTKKEQLARVHAELDITLFARHIAPSLHVKRRFVGTEPYCPVTSVYNGVMKELLPSMGVELVELERVEADGEAISASRVRRLLAEGRMAELVSLVPPVTFEYLQSEEAVPILERLRSMEKV